MTSSELRSKEMNEKVWKVNCLWILGTSLTMTGVANAACTPTPDCASIGYTETSCEGDSLKCPFDISKLFCVPCDSSFKYDCSGANMTGGVGSSCGGKYMSCSCSGGGTFNNGECPQARSALPASSRGWKGQKQGFAYRWGRCRGMPSNDSIR